MGNTVYQLPAFGAEITVIYEFPIELMFVDVSDNNTIKDNTNTQNNSILKSFGQG